MPDTVRAVIIKSTGNGQTWTRSAEGKYNQPMFHGKGCTVLRLVRRGQQS